MNTLVLNVEGMTCGHCKAAVEGAVKKAGAEGQVDLAAKTVTVEFNPENVTESKIREAIADQGYDVV
ncbi:MAG: cation transporter [Tumebacillaceae bacterium]